MSDKEVQIRLREMSREVMSTPEDDEDDRYRTLRDPDEEEAWKDYMKSNKAEQWT